MLSKFREPVNGLTHLGGAILAFFGTIVLLIVGSGSTTKLISVIIYGISLIPLFLASGIYHSARVTPRCSGDIAEIRPLGHIPAHSRHVHALLFERLHRILAVGVACDHLGNCLNRHPRQGLFPHCASLAPYGNLRGHGLVMRAGSAANAVGVACRCDCVADPWRRHLYSGGSDICHEDLQYRAREIRFP
jgi:hypothetical protein